MVNPFDGLYNQVQMGLKLFLQPYFPIFPLPSDLNFLALFPSGQLDLARRHLWTRIYKLPLGEFITSTGHCPQQHPPSCAPILGMS